MSSVIVMLVIAFLVAMLALVAFAYSMLKRFHREESAKLSDDDIVEQLEGL